MTAEAIRIQNLQNITGFITQSLENMGWIKCHCACCNKDFFTRTKDTICMSEKCSGINIIKTNPENAIQVKDINQKMSEYFNVRGYVKSYPLGVVNRNKKWGNTSLIVSGVQRLVPFLTAEAYIPDKLFISQPSVRTQYRGFAASTDWSISSFVNPTIIQANSTLETHFSGIKDWLGLLDWVGLQQNNVCLKLRQGQAVWGKNAFTRTTLDMFYSGLHISDAIYSSDFPFGKKKLSFSDIGGGLERIVGILNGGDFTVAQSPITYKRDDAPYYDALKALSLIIGSGANSRDKDAWQFVKRYQSILMEYSDSNRNPDLLPDINYYRTYWQTFTNDFLDTSEIHTKIAGLKK